MVLNSFTYAFMIHETMNSTYNSIDQIEHNDEQPIHNEFSVQIYLFFPLQFTKFRLKRTTRTKSAHHAQHKSAECTDFGFGAYLSNYKRMTYHSATKRPILWHGKTKNVSLYPQRPPTNIQINLNTNSSSPTNRHEKHRPIEALIVR